MYKTCASPTYPLRLAISQAYRQGETDGIQGLLEASLFSTEQAERVQIRAHNIITISEEDAA